MVNFKASLNWLLQKFVNRLISQHCGHHKVDASPKGYNMYRAKKLL